MNVIRCTDSNFPEQVSELTRASSLFDPQIEERAQTILEAVRTRGDAALLEFTERFDGARLTAEQLAVTTAEFLRASVQAEKTLRQAIQVAGKNIERFSRRSLRRNWSGTNL